MKLLLRVLIIAAVSYGLAQVIKGIHVDTFWIALIFAAVLVILNFFIKPLLVLLTLPVTIITLGLFLFVINAAIVLLASRFVDGFRIDNFWWGLFLSLVLTLITSILDKELKGRRRLFS